MAEGDNAFISKAAVDLSDAVDQLTGTDLLVRAAFHGQSDVTALLEVSNLSCLLLAEESCERILQYQLVSLP